MLYRTLSATLFVISGIPGAGKTTLGHELSSTFRIPFTSKDMVIEMLFDTIGRTPDNIGLLREKTFEILYGFISHPYLQGSVVVDANFDNQIDSPKILQAAARYEDLVQIHCACPVEVAFQRFFDRHERGDRHPMHTGVKDIEEYRSWFVDEKEPKLDLGNATCITIDTTDLESFSIRQAIDQLQYLHQEEVGLRG